MSATTAKAVKAVKAVKKPSEHPTYGEMIKTALGELKERGGSSRAAILKYITANFSVGTNANQINAHLKQALKRGVVTGVLAQPKGTGASGSFKLASKKTEKKDVKMTAAAEKKAKSPKKTTPKAKRASTPATPKKAAAKTFKKTKKAASAATA